ncbi:MAG: DUF3617 family protein, partial [Proteobacteria bacterium]|nr:DUF3617 family protein [Pseudomonadota bacterium]
LAQQGHAHEEATGKKKSVQKTPLPARKPGMWEVTVRSDDLMLRRKGQASARSQTVQMCTSAQAEPVMLFAIVPGQQNCREVSVRPRSVSDGGGWDIHTACLMHDNPTEADMLLTGDLAREYRGAYSVRYAQTPINNTGRVVFEGRWLGTCKPGQRPGDMVLPNGVTVNVVDDKRRAEGEAGHRH